MLNIMHMTTAIMPQLIHMYVILLITLPELGSSLLCFNFYLLCYAVVLLYLTYYAQCYAHEKTGAVLCLNFTALI